MDVALRDRGVKVRYRRGFDECFLAGSHGLLGDVADVVD